MSIERKPSNLELKLILGPIRKYIERTYNVTVERNDTIGLKPPYVILSNHVTNWDPLFINCYVQEPISFVAAAPVFRNPVVKKALDYVGTISKTKARTDSSTIREIIRAKKANRVIGIFPEGNRTWNSQTEPLIYSTSKLIKSLNIPVVVVTIKGGYLSQPRWSDSVRKGKVVLSYKKIWGDGEVKAMEVDDIHEQLTKALHFDDIKWQEQSGIEYNGKQLAHYLERHLYACPSCHAIGTMHSRDNLFSCKKCDYTVRYTSRGTFEQVNKPMVFEHVYDWDQWQQHLTKQMLTEGSFSTEVEDRIELKTFQKNQPDEKLGEYRIRLTDNGIRLTAQVDEKQIDISFKDIESVNVHKHHKLAFHFDNHFYDLQLIEERASAYMWFKVISIAKDIMAQNV